jgi:CheY-like chemotaxis protein
MPSPIGRVLIVDDDPQVAGMLRDVATTLGYAVETVESGLDALRLIPELNPDVILLDMTLPGLRGEAVLERVHADNPDLPIVMLTGNTDPVLARQTLALGAFDYIAKPFDLARLVQVLEAALASRG